MGRHHVFMLILEFFYLSENFYKSGRVTMSTLRIRGCLWHAKTINNFKKYPLIFKNYSYLNKTECEALSYKEKILNLEVLINL